MIVKKLSDMKRGLYDVCGTADAETATVETRTATAGTAEAETATVEAGTATAGTAVAVGNFDGMHQGHMALIDAMLKKPAENVCPASSLPLKTTQKQKRRT